MFLTIHKVTPVCCRVPTSGSISNSLFRTFWVFLPLTSRSFGSRFHFPYHVSIVFHLGGYDSLHTTHSLSAYHHHPNIIFDQYHHHRYCYGLLSVFTRASYNAIVIDTATKSPRPGRLLTPTLRYPVPASSSCPAMRSNDGGERLCSLVVL